MDMRADIRKGYLARPAIMALMLLGFGVAFLYDGFVAYPREHAMFTTYADIRDAHTFSDGKYDVEAIDTQWAAAATERGWPVEFTGDAPGELHSGWDIPTQKVLGAVCLPFGLVVGFGFVRQIGRWVEADEQGLTASWGPRVTWEQITALDKARWKTKGIAYVHYRPSGSAGGAGDQRLKLDDWEYEREPMQAIAAEVEKHIDPTLIRGDAEAESGAKGPSAGGAAPRSDDSA